MPLVVECPSCGKKLKVPDTLMGKQVRCVDCAGTFVAEKPTLAPPPPTSPPALPPPPPEEFDGDDREEQEDRPSRRRSRRRDRGRDYEAHRGGMILAFGIISLVSVMVVPVVVGLPLGILAWIWGGRDLKKIDAGQMDPEGRSNTQIGYITGIIGTIVNAIALLGGCAYVIIIMVFVGALIKSGAAAFPTTPLGAPAPPPPPNPFAPKQPKKTVFLPVLPKLADYIPQRLG